MEEEGKIGGAHGCTGGFRSAPLKGRTHGCASHQCAQWLHIGSFALYHILIRKDNEENKHEQEACSRSHEIWF